jgi:outer membrane receptor protein involved in Fe transport
MKFFRKSALYRATSLESAAIAVAMLGVASIATPAYAQDAAVAPQAAECADENANGVCDSDEGGQIVVTGTRIARPTLNSQVPLTSVTTEDLTSTGEVSLGDALNDLPSLRSTFSSGNSSRFIGTAGLNFLDLRGLGTARTLVLVNGRRHVAGSAGDNRVDINTIPIDLVDRIDIVTGGNSAVYGSDAVAGVVNFIMKRDFDGLSLRGQAGISSRGDRGTAFGSVLWGRNFADGRANITVSGEYSRQEPLYFRERDKQTGAFSGRCQYQATDVTTGEPAAGDGIFDTTFLCGVRSGSISTAGTVGGLGGGAYLRFANNGDLVTDTFTQNFENAGSGNGIGGLGLASTLRETGIMLAEVNRYAFNLLSHFDVSDAFRPFVEAKYVRIEASGEGQPSFIQGASINNHTRFGPGDPRRASGPTFRCDNGFFTAQNLNTLRGLGLCAATVAGTTIPGSTTLRGNSTQTMPLSRFNADFGGRRFEVTRETWRAVAGIEGTFNDDWKYEVSANYGRFDTRGFNQNNLRVFDLNGAPDGFLLATDAVVAPTGFSGSNFVTNAAGQRVICRVNAVTNARPDCVPFNVFGNAVYDPRAYAFSHVDNVTEDFADQLVFSASVSGDLSQLFELPGGPIAFALGGEYRRERSGIDYDALTSAGGTFLNALQDFTPPKLVVKDLFGELSFPLMRDTPGFHELTVNLAGRVSDYNNRTGTVSAYNIQGVYAPIPDLRFRVAYATSVRAPTQGDLFASANQNFQSIIDPCNQNQILAGPNRVANCAAARVPTVHNAASVAACVGTSPAAVAGAPWFNCIANTRTVATAIAGNPNLEAERGKSWTVGAVFEPSFIPGLNLTVDWYRIRVNNLIAALNGQTIANLCYDSNVGLTSVYCSSITRDPATGLFNAPALVQSGFNFAAQRTEGIDFDLSYRKTFDNGHRINLRLIATRVQQLDNYIDVLNPDAPNRQLSELGDPQWSAAFNLTYDFGKWDVLYSARWLGKQTVAAAYETQNSYIALCPRTGASAGVTPNTGGVNGAAVSCTPGSLVRVAPNNADAFPDIWYPNYFYHDIRIGIDVTEKFRFYAGVSNLFDKLPPKDLLGTIGGEPYDSFGRNFFVGVNVNF